jgi:MFS family permease
MILVALLLAAFLVNLDTTLVNVALPSMVRELHATTTQLQWVVDASTSSSPRCCSQLSSLSDRFGRKGMLWQAGRGRHRQPDCGFTTSPAQLIAARR